MRDLRYQVLGPRKHRLCERATGRSYAQCLVNGGIPHGWARCYREKTPELFDNVTFRTRQALAGTGGDPISEGEHLRREMEAYCDGVLRGWRANDGPLEWRVEAQRRLICRDISEHVFRPGLGPQRAMSGLEALLRSEVVYRPREIPLLLPKSEGE